jgi:predicted nuclease of restriction endonuclease-like (RecB) superfamily
MKKTAAQKAAAPARTAKKTIRHTACGELEHPASEAPDALFDRVAAILDAARGSVVRAVNSRMVLAYWLIGREIVQDLQGGDERAKYGKAVLADLSRRLTIRYGEGYSTTNLKYFRIFYQAFGDRGLGIRHPVGDEFGQPANVRPGATSRKPRFRHPLGDELKTAPPLFHPSLSWSHYRAISRVEKPEARDFYENECVAAGWTKRELERQIHSFYYERLLLSKDKQGMLLEQRTAAPGYDPAAILKSSTVLEFLGLPNSPRLHESKLEQAIMDNLQTFLLELGRGFSFVARQKRLVFDDDEFFVDLVFYNYLLKCFVLIDLKMGKLTHQDVGQMDSYVRMYEDLHKVAGDNPTIGLILCSQKNETIARYSVLKESRQLFASKYRLHLPTEEELATELKREILAIQEGRGG